MARCFPFTHNSFFLIFFFLKCDPFSHLFESSRRHKQMTKSKLEQVWKFTQLSAICSKCFSSACWWLNFWTSPPAHPCARGTAAGAAPSCCRRRTAIFPQPQLLLSSAHARDVKSEDVPSKSIYNCQSQLSSRDTARNVSCNSPTLSTFGLDGFWSSQTGTFSWSLGWGRWSFVCLFSARVFSSFFFSLSLSFFLPSLSLFFSRLRLIHFAYFCFHFIVSCFLSSASVITTEEWKHFLK